MKNKYLQHINFFETHFGNYFSKKVTIDKHCLGMEKFINKSHLFIFILFGTLGLLNLFFNKTSFGEYNYIGLILSLFFGLSYSVSYITNSFISDNILVKIARVVYRPFKVDIKSRKQTEEELTKLLKENDEISLVTINTMNEAVADLTSISSEYKRDLKFNIKNYKFHIANENYEKALTSLYYFYVMYKNLEKTIMEKDKVEQLDKKCQQLNQSSKEVNVQEEDEKEIMLGSTIRI